MGIVRADRVEIAERFLGPEHNRLQGSQCRTRIQIASQIWSGRARLGDGTDSKLSMQTTNPLRRRREVFEIYYVQKKTKIHFYGEISGVMEGCRIEIAERAVRRVKEGTSSVLVQPALQESWRVEAVECYCYLRNVQDHQQASGHLMIDVSNHHLKSRLFHLEQR